MKIITMKARLLAPLDGSKISIRLDDPASLTWGINELALAEGHERAVVDWGDGTRTEISASGTLTHAYPRTGAYEVRISDDISAFHCASRTTTGDFRLVYPPMIRAFATTASNLKALSMFCFADAVNLSSFRYEGSGLRTLGPESISNCRSLVGRLDLPHVADVSSTAFTGSAGIFELHFSAADEREIRASPGWISTGGTFGADNATTFFDL